MVIAKPDVGMSNMSEPNLLLVPIHAARPDMLRTASMLHRRMLRMMPIFEAHLVVQRHVQLVCFPGQILEGVFVPRVQGYAVQQAVGILGAVIMVPTTHTQYTPVDSC